MSKKQYVLSLRNIRVVITHGNIGDWFDQVLMRKISEGLVGLMTMMEKLKEGLRPEMVLLRNAQENKWQRVRDETGFSARVGRYTNRKLAIKISVVLSDI